MTRAQLVIDKVELESEHKKLVELIEQLQRSAIATSGAIQYIDRQLARLEQEQPSGDTHLSNQGSGEDDPLRNVG